MSSVRQRSARSPSPTQWCEQRERSRSPKPKHDLAELFASPVMPPPLPPPKTPPPPLEVPLPLPDIPKPESRVEKYKRPSVMETLIKDMKEDRLRQLHTEIKKRAAVLKISLNGESSSSDDDENDNRLLSDFLPKPKEPTMQELMALVQDPKKHPLLKRKTWHHLSKQMIGSFSKGQRVHIFDHPLGNRVGIVTNIKNIRVTVCADGDTCSRSYYACRLAPIK